MSLITRLNFMCSMPTSGNNFYFYFLKTPNGKNLLRFIKFSWYYWKVTRNGPFKPEMYAQIWLRILCTVVNKNLVIKNNQMTRGISIQTIYYIKIATTIAFHLYRNLWAITRYYLKLTQKIRDNLSRALKYFIKMLAFRK